MQLSISNIAWDTAEDGAVAQILQRLHVGTIDVAPSKYFPDFAQATEADIKSVRTWWHDQGIDIAGMQALLYGTQGLNVFGSTAIQQALLEHLNHVCRIAAILGANKLVFGSPKNRDRAGLSDEEAHDRAVAFFRTAGNVAKQHGVVLCLEPVPPVYGANFMTSTPACADVVRDIGHPAIRMQLDTAAMQINAEDAAEIVAQTADIIGHVHLSEPQLVPFGDGIGNHALTRDAIVQNLPGHVAAIEMADTKNEPHLQAIERAVAFATSLYGSR